MFFGQTRITICDDAADLGEKSAAAVAAAIRQTAARQRTVRLVFAAGESQMTFLDALARQDGMPWRQVVCFSIDDFWAPSMPREFTCAHLVETQLYSRVRPRAVHTINHAAADPTEEADRYQNLLQQHEPIDILCQGVGTSGHLAFNEPGATDFEDVRLVRVVELHEQSKRQLLGDPNFKDLGWIPDRGITMTIPPMARARFHFTMVPLALKKPIMTRVLQTSPPTPELPATIIQLHLRRHPPPARADDPCCHTRT